MRQLSELSLQDNSFLTSNLPVVIEITDLNAGAVTNKNHYFIDSQTNRSSITRYATFRLLGKPI